MVYHRMAEQMIWKPEIKELKEKGLFEVSSEKIEGKFYTVDLLSRNCSCPSYHYRGCFKHLIKVIRSAEESRPEKPEHENLIYTDDPPALLDWFNIC